MGAVRDAHEAVRQRLAAAEVGTIFYRHTYRVVIASGAEHWVTPETIVSEARKGFTQPNISDA